MTCIGRRGRGGKIEVYGQKDHHEEVEESSLPEGVLI
jgi:hypothetical protein